MHVRQAGPRSGERPGAAPRCTLTDPSAPPVAYPELACLQYRDATDLPLVGGALSHAHKLSTA